ncbi:DUF4351 domain-containing protein [Microcoleus sp. FACHB-SPT15]
MEGLGEVLLDFSTVADFVTWLNELKQEVRGAIME